MDSTLYIKRVADYFHGILPSLFWGGESNSTLIVDIGQKTQRVRLWLPGYTPLHLIGIVVMTEDGIFPLVPHMVSTSSCYLMSTCSGNEKNQELYRSVTNFLTCTGGGIHTEVEDSPWIEINFGKKVDITSLKIINRTDIYAGRNWKLRISLSLSDGEWQEIYNHEAYGKLLLSSLPEYVPECPDDKKIFDAYRNFLTLLFSNIFVENTFFYELGLSPSERQQLSLVLNHELMFNFQREVNNHGMPRTFRFWQDTEKQKYLEDALVVMKKLDEISAHVAIGYGTVLAYARAGEFMPHDDDVDIIVAFDKHVFPAFSDALNAVESCLRSHGYEVSGSFLSHRWVSVSDGKTLDVFVGLISNNNIFFYPGPSDGVPEKIIFPAISVDFYGCTIPIPSNTFRYLEAFYGSTWRIPLPYFSHDWESVPADGGS